MDNSTEASIPSLNLLAASCSSCSWVTGIHTEDFPTKQTSAWKLNTGNVFSCRLASLSPQGHLAKQLSLLAYSVIKNTIEF